MIHSLNGGIASARNLGLENAKGQFISFIDSDDWIEPHTIETLVSAAQLTGSAIIDARSCAEYVGKTIHRAAGQNIPILTVVWISCLPDEIDNAYWNDGKFFHIGVDITILLDRQLKELMDISTIIKSVRH